MKKIVLLFTLLFQFTVLFAQKPAWGPWTAVSCYGGFKTSAINLGYVKTVNSYAWQVKIKSSYNKKVSFYLNWTVGGETINIGMVTLSPGEEYAHTSRYFKSSVNFIYCKVDKVCFKVDAGGCSDGCYALCDNGSPNQPNCDVKSTLNTTTSTASTLNQQASTNAYNAQTQRAQQDLQRQNQENANKQQQYLNAINAGVQAHNSGNYAEAKTQFSNALGLAATAQERAKAQDYYNKSVSMGKTTATVQVVQQGLGVISDIVSSWSSKRPTPVLGVNRVTDNDLFNDFTKDVIIEAERAGLKFNFIDLRAEQAFLEELKKGGEILHRNRTLNFSYNNIQVIAKIGIHYYKESIGMNFDINVDAYDQPVKDFIKSRTPFIRFENYYGKKPKDPWMMFIRYTERLNDADYDIFKQPFQSAGMAQPLDKTEITDTKYFEATCDFLAMQLEQAHFKFDSIYYYVQRADSGGDISMQYLGLKVTVSQSSNAGDAPLIWIMAANEAAAATIENLELRKKLIYYSHSTSADRSGNNFSYRPGELEKEELFVNIYRKGYSSDSYKGIEFYKKKAEVEAQKILSNNEETIENLRKKGTIYLSGKGVLQDYSKAIPFFTKASELGDSVSMLSLASIYERRGISGDYEKSNEWLHKAIDHGNADGYALLANNYQYGSSHNYKKVKELLEEGAAKSSAQCMLGLSLLYDYGNGVKKNKDKALEWAQKACTVSKKKYYCDYYAELLKKK